MREIIPSNRWITILLLVGILALVIYGAANHDPLTIVIVIALAVFLALPAALLFVASRRARRDDS